MHHTFFFASGIAGAPGGRPHSRADAGAIAPVRVVPVLLRRDAAGPRELGQFPTPFFPAHLSDPEKK